MKIDEALSLNFKYKKMFPPFKMVLRRFKRTLCLVCCCLLNICFLASCSTSKTQQQDIPCDSPPLFFSDDFDKNTIEEHPSPLRTISTQIGCYKDIPVVYMQFYTYFYAYINSQLTVKFPRFLGFNYKKHGTDHSDRVWIARPPEEFFDYFSFALESNPKTDHVITTRKSIDVRGRFNFDGDSALPPDIISVPPPDMAFAPPPDFLNLFHGRSPNGWYRFESKIEATGGMLLRMYEARGREPLIFNGSKNEEKPEIIGGSSDVSSSHNTKTGDIYMRSPSLKQHIRELIIWGDGLKGVVISDSPSVLEVGFDED